MTKKLTFTLILLSIFILPSISLAAGPSIQQGITNSLGQVGEKSGYGAVETNPDISFKIGQLISYVLAMLGVVFLVLVVISGIQWMTAGGNEEKVTKARNRLVNAAIGLGIIVAAYAITYFVIIKLQTTVAPPPQAPAEPTSCLTIDTLEECAAAGCIIVDNACAIPIECTNRLIGDCTANYLPSLPSDCLTPPNCKINGQSTGCSCQD